MQVSDYKLGAHVSISGGILSAFDRTENIGGNCLQIFACSPRDWKTPSIDDATIAHFKKLKDQYSIDPIYFHANYLINLAAENYIAELSVKSLTAELKIAAQMGIRGIIVHLGSFYDGKATHTPVLSKDKYNTLFQNIWSILSDTPEETVFIIENAGVRKIGMTLGEIGFITKNLHSNRVKVCLDTCHLHAAGVDLSTPEKLDLFLNEFDEKIGLDRLELFHLNDSKDPLGAFRDRHENIGEGNVGLDVFDNLLKDSRTRNKPFIIETPGFDKKGPDKKNLDRVKSIISSSKEEG